MVIEPSLGSESPSRSSGDRARSKRPLEATMIRSVMSRSTGFPGRWYVPQAQEPPAAWLFCQMISPRIR